VIREYIHKNGKLPTVDYLLPLTVDEVENALKIWKAGTIGMVVGGIDDCQAKAMYDRIGRGMIRNVKSVKENMPELKQLIQRAIDDIGGEFMEWLAAEKERNSRMERRASLN